MLYSLKKTATKTLGVALAASFILTTAMPVTQAEAGKRKHWKNDRGHHYSDRHYKKKRHYKKSRRSSSSDALAAGVIGFAIGAILADQARPRTDYVQPQPVYRAPQPVYIQLQPVYREPIRQPYSEPIRDNYNEPRVIRYDDSIGATYEPWSAEWANWCDNKYRSFNRSTGTFRGYDGLDHFCVVK